MINTKIRTINEVLADHASVSVESRNTNTDVVIDLEQLLLVRGELRLLHANSSQNNVVLAAKSYACTSLLNSLHGIFNLSQHKGQKVSVTSLLENNNIASNIVRRVKHTEHTPQKKKTP